MRVCVLTAIYGGYEQPAPLPRQWVRGATVEALMVTDRPVEADGWRNVVRPLPHLSARFAAKVPRFRPDLFTDADVAVWLDGSVEVRSPALVATLLAGLGDAPLGCYRHSWLHTLTSEAREAAQLPRYRGESIEAQAARYVEQGHPDDWGMWTVGVMARRPAATAAFGSEWMAESAAWSCSDQTSFPVVARRHGLRPSDLPFPGWENDQFVLRPHGYPVGRWAA